MATVLQTAACIPTDATIFNFPEAASQTFKKGQAIYLSSGKVAACATDAVLIAGFACQDASGITDTEIAVAIAQPGTLFEMNIYHSTPASAITAVTDVGTRYGLYVSGNKSYVDKEDLVNLRFVVVALSPKDTVGDTYGRVLAEVGKTYCQLSGTIL
jgi:hypothetical protein